MAFNGGCHLEVIQENVDNLKRHNYSGHIIIRTSVPPGTNSKYGTHYLPDLYPDNNKGLSNKTYLLGINYTLDNYEKLYHYWINRTFFLFNHLLFFYPHRNIYHQYSIF